MAADVVRAAPRRWLPYVLAAALAINGGVYVALLQPLMAASRSAGERSVAAGRAVRAAEEERGAVAELAARQQQTAENLSIFYRRVLPQNLAEARRVTHAVLPGLAARHDVTYQRGRFDVLPAGGNRHLGQLTVRLDLRGRYRDLRAFIHDVERAPEFVVIDDVMLAARDEAQPLAVTLTLSTYFAGEAP